MIDPSKKYRTRDGRAVRIYATDGEGGYQIHGAVFKNGWCPEVWDINGHSRGASNRDLVGVTLADKLRDQIPWSALRPEIRWVAMGNSGRWSGFPEKPEPFTSGGPDGQSAGWKQTTGPEYCGISAIVIMPKIDPAHWRETLIERPEEP